ncbi:rhodanese-like domain-containing protein [Orenia marismortui]|uniref:rhodanese-like domain-containing protein n=1 Tax=Orenia marismortui TaxID=46469 RepID=UPI000381342C|nr:rhodanese-like domain-containing protein [Orenia marismortui]
MIFDALFGSKVEAISPKETEEKLAKANVQILDVRTKEEYNQGHIPNSINIEVTEVENNLDKINKNNEIITVCASGMRSNRAAKKLVDLGYEKVKNMKGGMMAWKGKVE